MLRRDVRTTIGRALLCTIGASERLGGVVGPNHVKLAASAARARRAWIDGRTSLECV
jgi:hypothetical protein